MSVTAGPLLPAQAVVGVPAVLLALAAVLLSGLGLAGANPFWPRTPLTFSEAAALRDRATVVELLQQGADPSAEYDVRAGLISGDVLRLTPMQAAIRENREEIVAVLLARIDAARAEPLLCAWLGQAVARKSDSIPDLLRAAYPARAAACTGESTTAGPQ